MGSPTIAGGMTLDEQKTLLAEERAYQQQEEDKRRAQMLEDEKRREQAAIDERNRIAAEEAKRLSDINAAEQAVIDESKAADKAKEKSSTSKVSFYDALGRGVVNTNPNTYGKPK